MPAPLPVIPLPVIIVHHNTPEMLRRCLWCLQQASEQLPLLPIVVDTSAADARAQAREHVQAFALPAALSGHSSGHSLEHLAGDSLGHSVGQLLPCVNHSLAHAVNIGLQAALSSSNHPALVCMNADVFVHPAVWSVLLSVLQQPQVGMVGPVCVDGQGRWQNQGVFYRQYYGRLWLARQRVAGNVDINGNINKSSISKSNISTSNQVTVPWLSGCMQVIKRQVVQELGGMNSSFRFYNEDIEWCWRLRQAGWTCQLVDCQPAFTDGYDAVVTGADGVDKSADNSVDKCADNSVDMQDITADSTDEKVGKGSQEYKGSQEHDVKTRSVRDSVFENEYVPAHPVVHLGGSATPARASFTIEGYRGGYRLSQMYRSPVYQALHRVVLRGLIWQQLRQANTATDWVALQRGVARGNVFESPFGSTLQKVNPKFTENTAAHE